MSATYSLSPIHAMPKGEFSPFRNTLLVSATPSPSASRSSMMRFGLGTPAPARFMAQIITSPLIQPITPPAPACSSCFGVLVSATSTSPFGRT